MYTSTVYMFLLSSWITLCQMFLMHTFLTTALLIPPMKVFQENRQDSSVILLCHASFHIRERYLLFIVLLEHNSINIDLLFKVEVGCKMSEVCGLPTLLLSYDIIFEVNMKNERNRDKSSFPA